MHAGINMTVNSRVVLFSIAADAQAVDDLITAALRLGTLDIAVTRTMAQDNLTLTYQVIGANSTRVSAWACTMQLAHATLHLRADLLCRASCTWRELCMLACHIGPLEHPCMHRCHC